LDPSENVTTRDRVARAPLARDAEDTDGRRVNALGLFGRSFLMAFRERGGPFGLSLPRDRDREAVRFDFDRDGGETLGQLELEQVVHEAEERIVRVAHRPPFSSGFFRMRRHQGCAGAGAAHPSGEITEYVAFSSASTTSPTPSASAPPDPPSPSTTTTTGTARRVMRWMLDAIASACPRSSASGPGYAPGVSTRVTSGRWNFCARR